MKTNDEVYPLTRWVAVIVVPFLWLAFLILFFQPDSSGERFAWAIKPHMTAMYLGAGYLGGSWLFINAIYGKRWHHIAGGYLPITIFTWFMMISTFLHWDRFSNKLSFYLWLVLYVVTPFLVPALWNYNRKTDSGKPEANDILIFPVVLLILKLIAGGSLVYVIVGFIKPEFVINTWVWTLSPLTARVMCGWIALLGLGAFTMSTENRWSGWKTPLESIAIWHILVLVAALMNPSDFKTGGCPPPRHHAAVGRAVDSPAAHPHSPRPDHARDALARSRSRRAHAVADADHADHDLRAGRVAHVHSW